MANLNEEFSGDWLKAADLKDKRVNVIVKTRRLKSIRAVINKSFFTLKAKRKSSD
jgi:hypothetical protein